MNRLLVAIGVMLCAAVLATPAAAGLRHFHGNVSGGGTVDFDVLFKQGKPTNAGNFDLAGIPVDCQPSDTRVDFSTGNVVPIRVRAGIPGFSYVFRGFSAWISGRIKPDGKGAIGHVGYGENDLDSTGRSGCTTDGGRKWGAGL